MLLMSARNSTRRSTVLQIIWYIGASCDALIGCQQEDNANDAVWRAGAIYVIIPISDLHTCYCRTGCMSFIIKQKQKENY